jgi:hypothetical protein
LSAQLQGKNTISSILRINCSWWTIICGLKRQLSSSIWYVVWYQWVRGTSCLHLQVRTFIVTSTRTLHLSSSWIIHLKFKKKIKFWN